MVDKLRWGLLSTARINDAVIGPIRNAKRSELVAVASRSKEKAEEYAAEKNIPKAYGSYELLLKDKAIDVVYISLPNALHYEWITKALKAGKNVLCEKPLVTKLGDLDEVMSLSKRVGLVVFEAFMYLHHVQTQKIRELVDKGEIGKLHLIDSWFYFYLPKEWGNDIRLDPKLDGGCLWDIGVYPNSLSIFLSGSGPPDEVVAYKKMGATGVDIFVSGQMRFSNGISSQISVSFCTPPSSGARIVGDEGSIFVSEPWRPGITGGSSVEVSKVGMKTEILKFPSINPYLAEIKAMESCVLDGAEPVVPLVLSRQFLTGMVELHRFAKAY